ncbi:MAG: aminotransferase class I/II-fold pyridoxal phosphate-dependent enzyme [Eggerthellaceae bacterium]|jgi:threonine-phosphate decarboxylase
MDKAAFNRHRRGELISDASLNPELPETLPYDMRDEMNWVDFSTPANPLGTPPEFLKAFQKALLRGEISYRPDRNAYAFRRSIASYFEIPFESIICGMSPTQMIEAAAQSFPITNVGLSVPCPIEYEMALSNAGHGITTFSNPFSFAACDYAMARKQSSDFNAVLLAHPAFPTSRLVSEEMVREYLEECDWVIIDESYLELSLSGESFIPLTEEYSNLIIVRNPSVTFSLEGTPIAYLVAHPDTAERIRAFYDSTGISMFAELISTEMVNQLSYLEHTHAYLDKEIPWLQCMLSLIPGMHINPAEGSFVLCSFRPTAGMVLGVKNADELLSRLQLNGYLVPLLSRTAGIEGDDFFCISCRTHVTNQSLLTAMKKIITNHVLQ